jgi:hypothetical protein
MSETENFETWNVLKELGFEPDKTVISDIMPGLSFDFGNFTLSASSVLSLRFQPIILFTGVLLTSNMISEVNFELPRRVASIKLLSAFLVYYLDNAASGRFLNPNKNVAWLIEGRLNKHLLPWEIENAAYQERPLCTVHRRWLRLALNNLSDLIAQTNENETVEFSFDGTILKIICSGQVLAMSADGNPWKSEYTIPVRTLIHLPKRLMQERVGVSYWQEQLHIGNYCYEGIQEKAL